MARDGTLRITIVGDDKPIKKTLSGLQGALSDFAKAGPFAVAGAAAVAGGVFVSAFTEALDRDRLRDRMAAQLNLDEQTARRVGKVASDVWAGAWGENIGQVNEAITGIGQNLADLSTIADEDLKVLTTSALDLASVFDQDLNQVIRTAGVLVNNDLAKDAEEAFDILTAGFQNGADRSQDFLDTLLEYAEPLESMGIDGKRATDIIVRGLDEGVFTSDKLIDALKEFTIRAVDGSKASSEAYRTLGLDARETAAGILAGGDAAEQATDKIVTGLLSLKDPLERETAGVALFGAMWEDVGGDVILNALDPLQSKIEDVEGATAQMSETANDNLSTKLTSAWRSLQNVVLEFADVHVVPALGRIVEKLESEGLAGGVRQLREEWDAAWPEVEAWWTGTALPFITGPLADAFIEAGQEIGKSFLEAIGRGITLNFAGWFNNLIRKNPILGKVLDVTNDITGNSDAGKASGTSASTSASPSNLKGPTAFHSGGIVSGAGPVPILAHGGERVLSNQQERIFQRLAAALDSGQLGGGVIVQAGAIVTERQLEDLIVSVLNRRQRRNGSLGLAGAV